MISLGMVDYPQGEYPPGLGKVQWGMGRAIGSKGLYRTQEFRRRPAQDVDCYVMLFRS